MRAHTQGQELAWIQSLATAKEKALRLSHHLLQMAYKGKEKLTLVDDKKKWESETSSVRSGT